MDCGRIQFSDGLNIYDFFLLGGNKTGPGKPVWKVKDEDLYIYYNGPYHGLVVGNEELLKSGNDNHFRSMKHQFFLFDTFADIFLFRRK